jgi:gas vesicle protein
MDAKNLIGGLLAGVAVGVAIGMLLAPERGADTRKKIANGSRKLGDTLRDSVDGSLDTLKEKFNAGLDEVVRKGKDSFYNTNEKVKA